MGFLFNTSDLEIKSPAIDINDFQPLLSGIIG